MIIYVARLETRSFVFEAVGRTEDEARRAMRTGWRIHLSRLPDDVRDIVYTWDEVADDVTVEPRKIGVPYRDGEAM